MPHAIFPFGNDLEYKEGRTNEEMHVCLWFKNPGVERQYQHQRQVELLPWMQKAALFLICLVVLQTGFILVFDFRIHLLLWWGMFCIIAVAGVGLTFIPKFACHFDMVAAILIMTYHVCLLAVSVQYDNLRSCQNTLLVLFEILFLWLAGRLEFLLSVFVSTILVVSYFAVTLGYDAYPSVERAAIEIVFMLMGNAIIRFAQRTWEVLHREHFLYTVELERNARIISKLNEDLADANQKLQGRNVHLTVLNNELKKKLDRAVVDQKQQESTIARLTDLLKGGDLGSANLVQHSDDVSEEKRMAAQVKVNGFIQKSKLLTDPLLTHAYDERHKALPKIETPRRPPPPRAELDIHRASSAMVVSSIWIKRLRRIQETNIQVEKSDYPVIFLGGSCNPTTWRRDTAMPLLDRVSLSYYNPQVDEWTPELVAIEAKAKEEAQLLLFVIDNMTRAVASMTEVSEHIARGRDVVLVLKDIEDGYVINGASVTGGELKDLNRGRAYLKEMALRHGARMADTVHDAVIACCDHFGIERTALLTPREASSDPTASIPSSPPVLLESDDQI